MKNGKKIRVYVKIVEKVSILKYYVQSNSNILNCFTVRLQYLVACLAVLGTQLFTTMVYPVYSVITFLNHANY